MSETIIKICSKSQKSGHLLDVQQHTITIRAPVGANKEKKERNRERKGRKGERKERKGERERKREKKMSMVNYYQSALNFQKEIGRNWQKCSKFQKVAAADSIL